jgi:hypothetical protein
VLLQQLEVGSVRGHQLYRHPYIAEGFAVAKVVGDDVRIQSVKSTTIMICRILTMKLSL